MKLFILPFRLVSIVQRDLIAVNEGIENLNRACRPQCLCATRVLSSRPDLTLKASEKTRSWDVLSVAIAPLA